VYHIQQVYGATGVYLIQLTFYQYQKKMNKLIEKKTLLSVKLRKIAGLTDSEVTIHVIIYVIFFWWWLRTRREIFYKF
jgi:hypothetical protein